jgi:hypothetical protein
MTVANSLTYTGSLTVVTCWCGTAHAVPEELRDYQLRQHADGQIFSLYCPLGHTYHPSGKSKWATEKQAREAAEARATSLADQLAAADREAKRLARRARQGICPCCHRSFVNVKRHMDTKHPDHPS